MGFEFKKRFTTVEICGKPYELRVDAEEAGKITVLGQQLSALSDKADENPIEALVEADKNLEETLASMLGKDAVDEIFAGRSPFLADKIELFSYLVKEMQKASVEQLLSTTDVLKEFDL